MFTPEELQAMCAMEHSLYFWALIIAFPIWFSGVLMRSPE